MMPARNSVLAVVIVLVVILTGILSFGVGGYLTGSKKGLNFGYMVDTQIGRPNESYTTLGEKKEGMAGLIDFGVQRGIPGNTITSYGEEVELGMSGPAYTRNDFAR